MRRSLLDTSCRNSCGRSVPGMCSEGCNAREPLGHIVRSCSRAHREICLRHNRVAKLLGKMLDQQGFSVTQEEPFSTELDVRKPNLVAVKDKEAFVIDVTNSSDVVVGNLSWLTSPRLTIIVSHLSRRLLRLLGTAMRSLLVP